MISSSANTIKIIDEFDQKALEFPLTINIKNKYYSAVLELSRQGKVDTELDRMSKTWNGLVYITNNDPSVPPNWPLLEKASSDNPSAIIVLLDTSSCWSSEAYSKDFLWIDASIKNMKYWYTELLETFECHQWDHVASPSNDTLTIQQRVRGLLDDWKMEGNSVEDSSFMGHDGVFDPLADDDDTFGDIEKAFLAIKQIKGTVSSFISFIPIESTFQNPENRLELAEKLEATFERLLRDDFIASESD